MIDYGENAQRSLFSSNGTSYTRIVDANNNISFVELYKLDDFFKNCNYYRDIVDILLIPNPSVSSDDFMFTVETILDMNVDMLRLKETAAFLLRISRNSELRKEIKESLQQLEVDAELATQTWIQAAAKNPSLMYNYRSSLFAIPGVTKKIEKGEETFEDAYGKVETRNGGAYKCLLVHDMLGGKKDFTVSELSRVAHGNPNKNKELEEEYLAEQDKNLE